MCFGYPFLSIRYLWKMKTFEEYTNEGCTNTGLSPWQNSNHIFTVALYGAWHIHVDLNPAFFNRFGQVGPLVARKGGLRWRIRCCRRRLSRERRLFPRYHLDAIQYPS